MMPRASMLELLDAVRAEEPRLRAHLGDGWEALGLQLQHVAGALPAAADDEAQRLIDGLLQAGLAAAPEIFREILKRVLPTAGGQRRRRPQESSVREAAREISEIRMTGPPVALEDRGAGVAPRAKRSAPRPQSERLYVNVCLARRGGECVPKSTSLGAGRAYRLRLDIGALSDESVVENAAQHPFPAELLPPSATGHWLEVIAASADFRLTSRKWHLFLPRGAASWVCACRPGGGHVCAEAERAPYLFIPLTAPPRPGRAELRLGVYYGKNLVQSQRLVAEVVVNERPGEGYRSRIDYTLSAGLSDLERFPERDVHILTNHSADGTHRVVINGKADDVLALTLTEGQMRGAIDAVREGLRRAHFEERGGQLGSKIIRENLLDAKNAKSRDQLVADLAALAPLGWLLWTALLHNRPAWRAKLRAATQGGTATIQVSRTGGSEFVFPWALVYDIPLESGARLEPCPLLADAGALAALATAGATKCPHEQTHPRKNVLCPFGFWGFKHIVEQPPSMPDGASLPLEIRAPAAGAHFLLAQSTAMDQALSAAHLRALRGQLAAAAMDLLEADSRGDARDQMARTDLPVVYFYCHGKREALGGAGEPQPYLEIGGTDKITPADILAWSEADWPPAHWREATPLVFINGCHTAELTPEALVSFVDTFAGVYAAGVVGTEITLHQQFANEAALEFFRHLYDQQSVGDALRRMRLHFLAKANVLGLAYTPYCSAALRLVRRDT